MRPQLLDAEAEPTLGSMHVQDPLLRGAGLDLLGRLCEVASGEETRAMARHPSIPCL